MINGTSQITFPQALVGALLGRPSPSPINSRVSGAESLIRAAAEMDPVAMGQALDRLRGTGSPSHAVCYLFADEVPTVFTGPDPSRVMLMADRVRVPVVRESVVLYNTTGSISSCTLTRDWADPRTMIIFKSGTRVVFQDDGRIQSGILAQSWTLRMYAASLGPEENIIFPAGTSIQFNFDKAGHRICCTFDKNWTDPRNGAIFKSGTLVEFDTDGEVLYGILAQNWRHPRPLELGSHGCYQAGTEIQLQAFGNVLCGTLAEPLSVGNNRILPHGTLVKFSHDSVTNCFLGKDWTDPESGATFKSGTLVEFDTDGAVLCGTLARDWQYRSGEKIYQAGMVVKYKGIDNVQSCTPEVVNHDGRCYLRDTVVFHRDGCVKKGTLAKFDRIEGHELAEGVQVEFDEKGQLVFGV